jgi:hypothetical protein
MKRQVVDPKVPEKVIFAREIADGSHQTGGCCFRLRFCSKFDLPLHSVLIANDVLRVGAMEIFLEKCKAPTRLMSPAAGPKEQVARSDIRGITPYYSRFSVCTFSLSVLRDVSFFYGAVGKKTY